MPQISLYVDKSTLDKIERRARQEHSSISKWVGGNLRRLLTEDFPEGYFSLFGSLNDPTLQRPDVPGFVNDAARAKV